MKNRRAFTLIELLIVVAIIAILAAIAVPNFLEAQVRSKVSRVKADMRSLATALESYAVDNNHYPLFIPPGYTGDIWLIPWNQRLQPILTTPIAYMTSIPNDPFKHHIQSFDAMGNPQTPNTSLVDQRNFVYNRGDQHIYPDAAEFHGRKNWNLISAGPDNNLEGMSYAPKDEIMGTPGSNIYDPTNGTQSMGDVYRWSNEAEPWFDAIN